jgi:hypothetical protein
VFDSALSGPLGDLTMHVDPTGDLLAATVAFEQRVWAERYHVEPDALAGYHAPWDRASVFLVLADDAGAVRAMIRFVYPSPAGLPTLVDIGEEPWNVDPVEAMSRTGMSSDKVWDIATIAVGGKVTRQSYLLVAALYHGILKICAVNDIRGIVAVIDERVRRTMGALSLPVQTIPGTRTEPFWGSPATTPVWADLADVVAYQRRVAPEAYRLVTLGVGLDGIRVPSLESFRVDRSVTIELPRQSGVVRRIDLTEPSSSDRKLLES